MSTYLHDKAQVGDILDVSAPARDFVLTPSGFPRFSWLAPGPASRPCCRSQSTLRRHSHGKW
jgi:ferredoxin-NADP reductase